MIEQMPSLTEYLPALKRYLLEFPKPSLPKSESFFYWQKVRSEAEKGRICKLRFEALKPSWSILERFGLRAMCRQIISGIHVVILIFRQRYHLRGWGIGEAFVLVLSFVVFRCQIRTQSVI